MPNDDWSEADRTISEASFGMRFSPGAREAREQFATLSDGALEIAVRLTWRIHLAAASVLTTRKGHQAVLDALED
jgi:hypothetical protein